MRNRAGGRYGMLAFILVMATMLNAALLFYLVGNTSRNPDTSTIVSRTSPAIVSVLAKPAAPRPTLSDAKSAGSPTARIRQTAKDAQGSGVIIDSSGLVVTNDHVVANSAEIRVRLSNGRIYSATIVGRDPLTDLALLRIAPKSPLPALTLATSAPKVGEKVVALGNPLGYATSASLGIVSGLKRTYTDADPVNYIQHDAAINPGSSGGPIVNRNGEIVGINTAIPDATPYDIGIALAIPAATVKAVMAQLKTHGNVTRAALGIEVQQMDKSLAAAMGRQPREGLPVSAVHPGTAAAEAGLLPGDILLTIDGKPVRKVRDLVRILARYSVGRDAALTILRDNRAIQVTARLTKAAAPIARQVAQGRSDRQTIPKKRRLGITFAGEFRAKGQAAASRITGTFVERVDSEGTAYRAGLRPGDEILAIGNTQVRALDDAVNIIAKSKAKLLALLVRRRGEPQRFVVLPFRGAPSEVDHMGNSVEPAGGPY
jgi:S1-C subfamily serine protease